MLVLTFILLAATAANAWNKDMEVDGMFEGDIEVTPEQMERLQKGTNEFGSIIGRRWPNGRIPYKIESSFGSSGRQQLYAAFAEYHKHTCLRFVEKEYREVSYISFYAGSGCHSPVGKSGVNRISLQAPGCQNKGTIMHEIGHSLGLLHEQSRPDRDQYVTIHTNALTNQRMAYNFQKASNINSLGTPYDLASMMHYSSTAFARGGMKTITTKDRSKQHLIDTYNRISGFSPIDIQQLNLMYNCKNGGSVTTTKSTGGVVTTTKSTGGGCQDKNTNCAYWQRQGYCTNPQHQQYMKINCCKSCGISSCSDKSTNCQSWKALGYCTHATYRAYMSQNCCASCSA